MDTNPYQSPPSDSLAPVSRSIGGSRGVPYASAHGRAVATQILLGIQALIWCLLLASYASQLNLLDRIELGSHSQAEVESNDARIGGLATLRLMFFLATAVVFLMWSHRITRNLRSLGVSKFPYTPGWTVGWWFIPFMNLARPYQVACEQWSANDPEAPPEFDVLWNRKRSKAPALIGCWWLTWIIGNIAQNIAGASVNEARPTLDGLRMATNLFIGSSLLSIVAAVL